MFAGYCRPDRAAANQDGRHQVMSAQLNITDHAGTKLVIDITHHITETDKKTRELKLSRTIQPLDKTSSRHFKTKIISS